MKQAKCDIVDLSKIYVSPSEQFGLKLLLVKQLQLIERVSKTKRLDLYKLIGSKKTKKNRARLYYWIEHVLNCIHNETEEVREHLPWKTWKTYKGYDFEKARGEIKYEIIDLLHFILELMLLLDMDAEEAFRIYYSKHGQNIERQRRGY